MCEVNYAKFDEKETTSIVLQTNMVSQSLLAVEKFVIVRYEGELFPGRTTKVNQIGLHVSTMAKCTGGCNWPKKADEIDYKLSDIIKFVQYPALVKNRGTFKVMERENDWGR